MTPRESTIRTICGLWAPPPKLTVTQWADANRRLSRKSSAQIGEWKTRPYQREPMDTFTDPRIHTIVLMVAIQTLKTESVLNDLGYIIDRDPGPVMLVLPRDSDCAKFSKIRLSPMLAETPCLRGKVADGKSRKSDNTIDFKEFPGGHLSIVASGSPGNLAALPIRYVFCDEIDKYPASAGSAGDPISLVQGRQEEFWNRKTVLACSPTIKGLSRIESAWETSDKREYEICCPHCGTLQIPKWGNVHWDSSLPRELQPESARYHCENPDCGSAWNDLERWKASKNGRYRATSPFTGTAGFRVSGLARLGTHLSDLVTKWLSAQGNHEQLKAFINEQLCELWTEPGETLEWRTLLDRREPYPVGICPAGVRFLTAGVDVQRADGGRLEVEIRGFGENRERWSIDKRILYGNPAEAEVWDGLEAILHETFPHESGGELAIERMFIDSGDGTTTGFVYDWVSKQPRGRVWAIKGDRRTDLPVSGPKSVEYGAKGQKTRYGTILRDINVDIFKGVLLADLKKRPPTAEECAAGLGYPQGYCHCPIAKQYGDEHQKQLCAEQLVSRKDRRGRTKTEYVQLRPRNEALDITIYAEAAGWDYGDHKFQPKHWEILKQRMIQAAKPEPEPAKPSPVQQQPPPRPSFRPIVGRINL